MWLASVILLVLSNLQQVVVNGEPLVPCFFIFGDSLADSGNNNLLLTQAKANYHPYGIDFPYGQSGRFSNGKTSVDIIGKLLGFDTFIPSFPRSTLSGILKGVNYASGSSGIRDESGQNLGAHISMDGQLRNHQIIMARLVARLGGVEAAMKHLNRCLYYVGMGNNDYINNYFMPEYYVTQRLYTPEEYAVLLVKQHSQQLKALYSNGARKIALTGAGLIGCTPNAIARYGTNGSLCVDELNLAAFSFNQKLRVLVDELNTNYTDAQFILINSFADTTSTAGKKYNLSRLNFAKTDSDTGFKVSDAACCKVSNIGQCIPFQVPCENRDEYIFYDAFHTTEAANKLIANRAYKAEDPSDSYPFDIFHLVTSGTSVVM